MPTRRILLGVAAAVLGIAAVFLVLALRVRAHLASGSDELLAVASTYLGLPVRAQSIAPSWWPPGLVVEGVRIADESPYGPGDLARADEAELRVAWWPLVRGRIRVHELRLLRPRLRVTRGADGGWNLPHRAPEPPPRGGTGGFGWPAAEVVLETVRVRDGWVTYSDAAVTGAPEIELEALNLLLRRSQAGYEADFNARALGGPEENVQGRLWIPRLEAGDPGDRAAQLEMRGTELAGARLPVALALLGGELPFAVDVRGEVAGSVHARIDSNWPPRESTIELTLDAGNAAVEAGYGWVRKRPGTPASLSASLRATPSDLLVDALSIASAGAEVRARAQTEAKPAPQVAQAAADAAQPPLEISADGVSAASLAAWVPVLARLEPSGEVSLYGHFDDRDEGASLDLNLAGRDLTVRSGEEAIELGSVLLRSEIAHGEEPWAARISIDDARGRAGLTMRHIEASLEGGGVAPSAVRLIGSDGGRADARIDQVTVEGALTHDGADVSRLEVHGLGGTLSGSARLVRGNAARAPAELTLDTTWTGVDLAGVLALLGLEKVDGRLAGRAKLIARGQRTGRTSAYSVSGDFDATLGEATLPGVNPARGALARLDVPGLAKALERRGRERVPDLFGPNGTIESLHAIGTIADRDLTIASLSLRAPSYTLDAQGHVSLLGSVDLSGALALTPAATAALVEAEPLVELLYGRGRPIRIPVSIRGNYPNLDAKPARQNEAGGDGGAQRRGILDRLLPDGGLLSP